MAAPTIATAEGSLYELVARGNKDSYFFQDLKDSIFIYDNTYSPQAPSTSELRRIPSRTAAEFGRTVEFDLDLVGDLMTAPTLVINLPSWYPSQILQTCQNSFIEAANGETYGYTNGIAYFLFEQIQLYQDNILLQEFSGDALWAINKANGTYGGSFVVNDLTAQHDGSRTSISRNAAPPQLRLDLPLIGCQGTDPGFPQRSVVRHAYKLRCKIRRLEDLVESSASDGKKPAPWGAQFTQHFKTSSVSFTSLKRTEIAPINIQLETQQIYVPREYQEELETKPQRIAFKRHFENIFTQNQIDYAGVLSGGTSIATRRLDGRHPAGRLIWFFRSISDVNVNRLWKITTDNGGSYYNSISLQIAGQPRELPRVPAIWSDVTNFAKEEIDGEELASMNWGLGAIAPLRFPGVDGQPTGSVNFSSADRPTFYIDLANPGLAASTELRVIVEGWARFDTDGKGRGELFSAN